jgi:hypothetical protein
LSLTRLLDRRRSKKWHWAKSGAKTAMEASV